MKYYILPSSTKSTAASTKLTVFCDEGVNQPMLWETDKPQKKKMSKDSSFTITKNSSYTISFSTDRDEYIEHEFVIQFLGLSPTFSGGDGSSENPYLVSTPLQLNAIRENLSCSFKLINNIDLSSSEDWGIDWSPIGEIKRKPDFWGSTTVDPSFGFGGELDGNGYTISGMRCYASDSKGSSYLGLFGYISDGKVLNLKLRDCEIYGCLTAGGIAAISDGKIEKCHVSGCITAYDICGGIAGTVSKGRRQFKPMEDDTFIPIEQCSFTGHISSIPDLCIAFDRVGGIVGHVLDDVAVRNCFVSATLIGSHVGGISCAELTLIEKCIVFGSITSPLSFDHSMLQGIGEAYIMYYLEPDTIRLIRTWNVHSCVCALKELRTEQTSLNSRAIASLPTFDIYGNISHMASMWARIGTSADENANEENPNMDNYALDSMLLRSGERDLRPYESSQRDGVTCTIEQLRTKEFYENMGWDFENIWEMRDLPYLRGHWTE